MGSTIYERSSVSAQTAFARKFLQRSGNRERRRVHVVRGAVRGGTQWVPHLGVVVSVVIRDDLSVFVCSRRCRCAQVDFYKFERLAGQDQAVACG